MPHRRTVSNEADAAFTQQMIPHHEQAVEMAKLVPDRSNNPELLDLAKRVEQAQQPEIEKMTAWLRDWGAEAPTAAGGHGDHGMAGMMSDSQMTELWKATGTEFDRMWLRMMIEHHKGALEMARTDRERGTNAQAKELAKNIIDGQQAEIDEMNAMLG
ncbi:hypothetical protein GCM10012275_10270 [Longimycelium tulufanense]|uniref:DUF305 domain-containing protein n=1 Tax=Longimycelium tulufanense TaxID=907463 RepID=A0A8J3CAR2_9PSEU|nr:DUF305 domain-containing protein [Longimycelium tulufanense]GGM41208.1 hypothetical protein GCM10012275_10270 [Longimycelium tulufanense]